MILVIFMIFPAAGNKKNNLIIMKKNGADLEGLLPKSYCEEKKKIVLQESGLYCRDLGLDNLNCITGLV